MVGDGDRLVPVVSALIFCIGAGGVLTRRNPLVILLCLELMLNAANLALVAFARMWGGEDGQIFALIVMVVAACEVTVGLGLIVAIYRRQPADRRRRAARVEGMMSSIGRRPGPRLPQRRGPPQPGAPLDLHSDHSARPAPTVSRYACGTRITSHGHDRRVKCQVMQVGGGLSSILRSPR